MTCPSCAQEVPDGARFCSHCGESLGARDDEQRRVVTVLFADLVGFTTLSEGSDPEQVKRLVDGCFEQLVEIVEAFGGRVDKIIGDALLALFGAPVGHEDDAERAVRAALRMQETLQSRPEGPEAQLRLRVGVNTGEVLVGALRSGGDYTAMGDVVNTAQRLQAAAEPGQVLVGPTTRVAAGDRIDFEPLGLLRVRGRGEPVDGWRAVAALLPPGRDVRRTDGPLVGRGREMAVLTGQLDLAIEQRRAQLQLLVGDAGVGKNRLARELVAHARACHDAWVLEGQCVPYGEANVWWPVAEALRQAAGIPADATAEGAGAAVADLAARVLATGRDDPDVSRITAGILELLGYEGVLREIDPGRAREEAMRALVDLTAAAGRERPVVVVLGDLHWADQVVFDAIDQLTDRLGRSPYVILGTARPAIHERWSPGRGRHNTTVLHVEPLDREAADTLLTVLLGDQVTADVREGLLDRSGGNPFFLEELAVLLEETGVTPGRDVGATDHGVAELSGLPDSLRGLLVARLDALDAEERAVVENAAVLGRSGPVEALEIMGAEVHVDLDVGAAVERLADKEVLLLDEGRWSFRSHLVRDVAYGTMTKVRRAATHAGIASWMEEHLGGPEGLDSVIDRMAHHYGTAAELVADLGVVDGVPNDVRARALHWIGEASTRALESEHHLAARHLFTHTLVLLGEEPSVERWEALLGRSRCRANLRDVAGAREDADVALVEARRAGAEVMVGRALTAVGDAQQKAGDAGAARVTLAEAVDALAALDADRARGEALRLLGMAQLFDGARDDAEVSISAALDVARSVGDRQGEAWALQNLAWLAFESGRTREAEEWVERSVRAFREIGDTGGLGWALGLSAWVKMHVGARDEAGELAARMLPDARARGDQWAEAMMHLLQASVHLWSGRAAASLAPSGEAEALFEQVGDTRGLTQARVTSGRAMLMLGRLDEGWALLRRSHAEAEEDRSGRIGVALGAAALGDPSRARVLTDHLEEGPVDPETIGGVDLLAGLALLRLQEGKEEAAGELVDALVAPGRSLGPALAAAATLVEAARGRVEEARRLAESISGARRSTYLDRAMGSIALGLIAAGADDAESAAVHFAGARAEVDGTDDRLHAAVVTLAEAEALTALDAREAAAARAQADERWRELGTDPAGWRSAFAPALRAAGV